MQHQPGEILTNDQMREADRLTIEGGVAGQILMENAGQAVASVIMGRWPKEAEEGPVLILCGPGNNGGDGFVIARALAEAGYDIDLRLAGDLKALTGDAALMARKWEGTVSSLEPTEIQGPVQLIVDALFGSGLTRSLDGPLARVIQSIDALNRPVVSVDIPSGVDGDTGETLGTAVNADVTVTFFRKKLGHILRPGVTTAGEVIVRDIGIKPTLLEDFEIDLFENGPALWLEGFPWPTVDAHKFSRGHGIVMSGGASTTGAARLAAYAALRSGAGLVTIGAPSGALAVVASQIAAVMVREIPDLSALEAWLEDDRISAVLLGPGNGIGERTRESVLRTRAMSKKVVLDADALTSFEGDPAKLFDVLDADCVLTPHEGEFRRLFPEFNDKPRLERARAAAVRSGANVLLKGPETVIAAPSGRAAINTNGSAWLATAGSGDVLAGIIMGLIAQGMPGFEAACAGAWIHGATGNLIGPGLIAEDIIETIPEVLESLYFLDERGKSS